MFRKYMLWLVVLFVFPFSVYAQDILPEGEGGEIVEYTCTQCHGLEYITASRKTLEQWEYIVSMMIRHGAELEEDEVQSVINYLANNFGQ